MPLTDKELVEYELLLKLQLRDKLKGSLFLFLKYFWHVFSPKEFTYNWHIEYLCNEVQKVLEWVIKDQIKEYDLIINISPGATKSTIVSRAANAWLWANTPNKTVICNTIDSKNANGFAMDTKKLIESEEYKELFPYVSIDKKASAKTFYQTTQGGRRYSITTKGSSTGKHADVIFDDDPMDYKTSLSQVESSRCIDGFIELQTRKTDKEKTPYILVMQRLSRYDTTAHALKTLSKVKHICLPAENIHKNVTPEELNANYIDGLLDPIRLSRKILSDAKKGLSDENAPLSDVAYEMQFNQSASLTDSFMYNNINVVDCLPLERQDIIRYSFTDVADTGDDYFATWFVELNQGKLYVFDAIYTQEGSGITSEKITNKILQHNSVVNKIETNNQGSVFVTLLQTKGVNVSGYYSSGNKEQRISAYSQFINKIYFVKPQESNEEYRRAFRHIQTYPKQGKAADKKDDAEDSLTELIRYFYVNYRELFV